MTSLTGGRRGDDAAFRPQTVERRDAVGPGERPDAYPVSVVTMSELVLVVSLVILTVTPRTPPDESLTVPR
jgi:hypothetical protein